VVQRRPVTVCDRFPDTLIRPYARSQWKPPGNGRNLGVAAAVPGSLPVPALRAYSRKSTTLDVRIWPIAYVTHLWIVISALAKQLLRVQLPASATLLERIQKVRWPRSTRRVKSRSPSDGSSG
jgi:hypothetical protein